MDKSSYRSAKGWGVLALVLLFSIIAIPQPMIAQENPEAEPAPTKPATPPEATPPEDEGIEQPQSMLEYIFKATGLFFGPVLFCMSFVAVGLIILYSIQMRSPNFIPDTFIQSFESMYKEKKFQDAYDLARKEESFVGKMLAAGIGRLSSGHSQAMEAMQDVAEDEGMKNDHRLSYLAMIGNLATMVGLLGTVVGMVSSFRTIATSGTSPKPQELAQGVSTALVTTVWGLCIAIPAILGLTILKNRAARLGFESSLAAEQLMNRFSSQTKRSSGSAAGGNS